MPKVRPGATERWVRRTSAATSDYQSGVQSPRVSWKAATAAAEAAHVAGVQKAIQEKRFAKGVARTSDQDWAAAAAGKGAERFAGGVAAGQADYEKGISPYIQTIETVQLPPRGPKGDPRNYQRVQKLGEALHAKKLSS
jgi:hypothetical protein